MKKTLTLALLLFALLTAHAQQKKIDTARLAISKAKTDTEKYIALFRMGGFYGQNHPDSALIFDQQAFLLAKKNNWAVNQARSLNDIALDFSIMGDYVKATQNYLKALKIYEGLHDLTGMARVNNNISFSYGEQNDPKQGLAYTITAKKQLETYALTHKLTASQRHTYAIVFENMGGFYTKLHRVDSAEKYSKISYELAKKYKYDDLVGTIQAELGEEAVSKGKYAEATRFFRQALASNRLINDAEHMSGVYLDMADLYHKGKQQDSAKYYAKKALEMAESRHFEQDALDAGKVLYTYYDEDHNLPEAFKYFKLATVAKDSLYSQDKVKQLLSIDFDEKMRQQELQTTKREAEKEAQNKLRTYILSGGLGVLLLLALVFWRNSNQRKKANRLLSKQKKEIEDQRDQTNKALTELQQTQTQLVQREKMASLGELTAGIAHEIQNPLNFVNNFSDVNQEMLEELKAESIKPKAERDEQLEVELINGLIENEQKINHHGKRADFIVKGMLQHSRTSTGEKQLTNINVLADEFFRLSYHGLRAKDKSFNAELTTHFDENLPKVDVVQQDIGRVLLNLFNNAFYAVNQKAKTAGADYKPEVTISTSSANGQVTISVKDNGVGIPDAIKEKILQPFFTTKPTGEGTGLGLSLSYDILVKGHSGTLDVISNENEGAEFIVKLPLN